MKYDCINRYIGKCTHCTRDYLNLSCSDYYPLIESLGGGIVPPRNIKDDLVKKISEDNLKIKKSIKP